MNCHTLAKRLSEMQPDLGDVNIARLCLLMLSQVDDASTLDDEKTFQKIWQLASFRLESATDQYAAVSQELDELCSTGPMTFSPDQLWILLRAIKVQSQILELYTDEPVLV